MKYGIWRHENALGNSAEHTVGLAKHLKRTGEISPEIIVETEFQKYFAMCIPGIKESDISFFGRPLNYSVPDLWRITVPEFEDIYMPNVYDLKKTFKSSWADLSDVPDVTLIFPDDDYENKHNLPKDVIVISIREMGTYDKRNDGANSDRRRFVNPKTFFNIAIYYAKQGYTVVRVGDKNQTPMPKHSNIIDFALVEDRNMLDDLFLISKAKVFLSCDSGIWPMAGGMKSNLVLSNVTSDINKPVITSWLPKETSIVLHKNNYEDNTFDELKNAVDSFL